MSMNENANLSLSWQMLVPAILCQALFTFNHLILMTLGILTARYILPVDYQIYASVPYAITLISSFVFTASAGSVLRNYGFKTGFVLAGLCGAAGSALFCLALIELNFFYLAGSGLFFGVYQSFAGFLRFAAADKSPCCHKPSAIGAALGGGLIAALLVPFFIETTLKIAEPVLYLGVFSVLTLINLIGLLVPLFMANELLSEKKIDEEKIIQPERALKVLMKNPRFLIATYCGLSANAAMHFIAIAAPAAMVGCGLGAGSAAFAIQTHAVAMFAPAFFTGKVIRKLGKSATLILGFAFLIAALPVAFRADDLQNAMMFQIALILLGIGWNFTFLSASVMLTECYCPCERTKVQAAHDTIIYAGTGFAILFAGAAYEIGGWDMILATGLPILLIGLMLSLKLKTPQHSSAEL